MFDTKMEDLSSSIQDRLLGRRTKPQATGPSSEQGGEGTTAGVSLEIPVSSESEAHQHLSSQGKREIASGSKINLSNVASTLSLPLIVTSKDKHIMTTEESELSDLQKIQQEIKMQEAEKRNKVDLDKDL